MDQEIVYIFFMWQGLELDCRRGAPVNHLYLALKTQESRDEFYTALVQLPGKYGMFILNSLLLEILLFLSSALYIWKLRTLYMKSQER